MPLDSSIPFQSMAPDPMVSLNSMLDMGTKSLSLAKNRATFDADVARSKAESSTAESGAEVNRANIQPLIRQQAAQTSSAQSKAQVDQANVNPLIQQQAAQTQTAQLGAGNAAVDLNTKKTQNAVQALQSLMQDPNLNAPPGQPYSVEQGQKTVRGVLRYMEDTGQDQDKIEKMRGPLNEAVKTQGGVADWLKGQLRTGLTPGQNISASTPTGINVTDGVNSSTINTNPMAQGGVGSTIKGTAQVAQPSVMDRESQGVDKNGNPLVNVRNQDGSFGAPKSLPGNTTKPVVQFDPGYNEAQTPGLLAQADAARTSRNKAQEMHSNNRGILDAINDVIATGPTGSGFARFAGVAGTVSERAEKAASAYDTIGKLTERNALAAAAAMGNGTNAQLDAQVKANGSASYNPTALRKITMLSDALQTGVEKYTAGMEKAIAAKGYISGKIKFDEAWSQNANVDTLRYLNAVKTKNTKEQAEVLKSAGEVGSPGRLKMTQELNNLHKLSQTGAL